MTEADLVITGGKVVSEHGVREASIAVQDGRIVAVGEREAMPSAKRTIDASGRHVFPGIIDPHIHLQTFANKFDINIKTETKTAAVGGVTTIVPTLLNREDNQISFLDHFPWCKDAVDKYATVDVAFSAVLGNTAQIREIPRMATECGITSTSSTWRIRRMKRRSSGSARWTTGRSSRASASSSRSATRR